RVQLYYPEAGMFMNTSHTSDDADELKRLVAGDTFLGFRVRIVDDTGNVVFAPPVRERATDPNITDLARVLGVPVIDYPGELLEAPRSVRLYSARPVSACRPRGWANIFAPSWPTSGASTSVQLNGQPLLAANSLPMRNAFFPRS